MMRLIEVAGTAHQRGLQQGRPFAGSAAQIEADLGSLPVLPRWVPTGWRRRLVRRGARALGAYYLGRHDLDAEMLAGLAEGFGESPAWVYGINAFEVESAHVGFSMGCTSLAIDGSRRSDGAPRLAYNHDFPPAFAPYILVRKSAPHDGYRSLTLTYPTMVGAICGVNEHGLAMSYDQAYATDLLRGRRATLVSMSLQACLDRCRDVDEAVAWLTGRIAASGALVTLVDARGGRAAVELSGTRHAVRRARAGEVLYSFNKYRVPEMEAHEIPVGALTTGLAAGYDVHRCNITRERRFLELERGQRLDDAAIQAILSDHDGGSGSQATICRHRDPLSETILTALVDPVGRSLEVCFGHACEAARGAMARYALDASEAVASASTASAMAASSSASSAAP